MNLPNSKLFLFEIPLFLRRQNTYVGQTSPNNEDVSGVLSPGVMS
jgi:hypothetical protein